MSFEPVPSSRTHFAIAPETPVEGHSKQHMQLRTAFLKPSSLRGFKNGDGKAGKTGDANAPAKKGCVEGRNLCRRRARTASATAARAPASDAEPPASSSSHSVSGNTTATTLTPQSSQGVPSPCRDQDGSLLPSLPPLPPLPLAGRCLTSGIPERGKSVPRTSSRRGRRRGGKGLKEAILDAPGVALADGGGGVCRGGASDGEDTSEEKKIDEDGMLLLEMSDLLVGEREQRYGMDGDSSVVELLNDESSHDGDSDWSERVGPFYASDNCRVPPTREPSNLYDTYQVRQERSRVSSETREAAGGKETLPAVVNNPKASVRGNLDAVKPCRGNSITGSSARAQETEQREKNVFMVWPEGIGKGVGEGGHQTWWSRLRTVSDGSAVSTGSGGFFGQALSALAAAASFDSSLQAPRVTRGSSRVSRGSTDDGDAAGGRRSGGGGSRGRARERGVVVAKKVSDGSCNEYLVKRFAETNEGLAKVGAAADGGAGVVTAVKQQARAEREPSGTRERKQAQAAPVARTGEVSVHDCETPSRSRRLLLESPFFRKAKGLSDLKKILGTAELREGFRQFLSKRWCAENIDFIEQVMRYQEAVRREGGANAEVLALGGTIEETFLLKASPKEVNIGQDMRVACLDRRARDEKLGVAAVDTFDIVAFELLSMMAHTSLRDFKASAHYATIEACLELGPRELRNSIATSSATFFDEEDADEEDVDDEICIDRPRYGWSRPTSRASEEQGDASDWSNIEGESTAASSFSSSAERGREWS